MVVGWFILHDKVVFLDRDGVINKKAPKHDYIKTLQEFEFLPNVDKAIRLLNNHGFIVLIITNQRGIARGLMKEKDLYNIHQEMCAKLREKKAIINDIFVCPHENNECTCRKPNIGLFLQAEAKYLIDKKKTFMVGDSNTDIEAGKRYGVKTIAINKERLDADYRCNTLLEAVNYIIGVDKK
jgi:D-glycero-D-manno-heptose 1,7-bisphosphate phosphatase